MGLLTDHDADGVRSADPAAFGRVYRELAPAVEGYLRARGSADPEGLAQEVFLTIFRRSGELTGGLSGLRTFAFSIAHARLVDELRSRSRRPDQVEYEPDTDPRLAPSAEGEAVTRLGHEATVALLARLPKAQRDVVSLRVVAGLSLEETAEVIGRSTGSVKQLQRRGLLTLRAFVEDGDVTP